MIAGFVATGGCKSLIMEEIDVLRHEFFTNEFFA